MSSQFGFTTLTNLSDYKMYSEYLTSQINALDAKLHYEEKTFNDKTAPLREEAARERSKYKQLER